MIEHHDFSLTHLTTFGVPATAARYVRFDAPDEIEPFLAAGQLAGQDHLILGGGSNLLFVDFFTGIVLHPRFKGIEAVARDGDQVIVRAMAGEVWDDLVAHCVDQGWGGLENLALIPGSVGASAVQNVGAYGVEAKDVIARVEAIDLSSGQPAVFEAAACGFDYRYSHFKGRWAGRYLITAVLFRLAPKPRFVLDYPGVRQAVERLGPVSLANVRRAIVEVRRDKLPDPDEIGNAGSFFKNPVVTGAVLAELKARFADIPHYPLAGDRAKIPAGWLIDRCGWKGRQVGRAGVHAHQALVLVNHGGATGREIFELSEKIRADVVARFGIDLQREVLVVGNL